MTADGSVFGQVPWPCMGSRVSGAGSVQQKVYALTYNANKRIKRRDTTI